MSHFKEPLRFWFIKEKKKTTKMPNNQNKIHKKKKNPSHLIT